MRTAPATLTLVPFEAGSPGLEQAVAIYVACWQRATDTSRDFFERYAMGAGFVGRIALQRGVPVGMAFGTNFVPGTWWCDRVASKLGAGHPALADAWVLVELAVLAEARQRGIGTRLHDAVFAAARPARAVLSTGLDNVAARTFYARHGWREIGAMNFHPGAALHLVLAKELGGAAGETRTMARPADNVGR